MSAERFFEGSSFEDLYPRFRFSSEETNPVIAYPAKIITVPLGDGTSFNLERKFRERGHEVVRLGPSNKDNLEDSGIITVEYKSGFFRAYTRSGESYEEIVCSTTKELYGWIERIVAPKAKNEILGYQGEDGSVELELDVKNRVLSIGEEKKLLTRKLSKLLELFLRHKGEILSRRFIMREVWKTDYMGDTGVLDVTVCNLRKILGDDAKNPQFIHTFKGIGYRFGNPPEEET